jgi:hypothetical protein
MKNWYKIAQNLSKIQAIAKKVYQQMSLDEDDETLKSLCLPAARKVTAELNKENINSIVVQGTFTIDDPDFSVYEEWDVEDFGGDEEMMEQAIYTPLHYWAEVLMSRDESQNIIVDITASQFNDELNSPVQPIIIGTYAQLPRYTPITKDWI